MKDMNRGFLMNKNTLGITFVSFVVFNCILLDTLTIPYIGGYVRTIIGCSFIWSLSFYLLTISPVRSFLTFVGRYSLHFYWLNGFALVVSRIVMVKLLGYDNVLILVVAIFVCCVILESFAILFIRRMPLIREGIGIK